MDAIPYIQRPFIGKPGARYAGVWNWGAFSLAPFWLMNHGLAMYGWMLLILGPLSGVGFFANIYCGVKGNELAIIHREFVDEEQFVAVQNAWRNWGIPLFFTPFVLMFVAWLCFVSYAIYASIHHIR